MVTLASGGAFRLLMYAILFLIVGGTSWSAFCFYWIRHRARVRRESVPIRCPHCAYSMQGLPLHIVLCSECGGDRFDDRDRPRGTVKGDLFFALLVGLVGIAIWTLFVLVIRQLPR